MTTIETTELIERLLEHEKKLGIEVRGIHSELDDPMEDSDEFYLTIRGEVRSISGETINRDVLLEAIAYNDREQVIGIGQEYIIEADFFGFQAFEIIISLCTVPSRVKIVPKPG